jgi:hypothetical protein
MIYHREKIEHSADILHSAVVTLYKAIPPHDVFIVAADEKHIDRMKRMESVAKCAFSKPSWIKQVNENKGVIFTITSGMFRRKNDRQIREAIEYTKAENEGLTVDVIENSKFSVFFFGIKTNKKTKDVDDVEPVETIQPEPEQ